jgi:hypothetical protein
VLCGRLMRDPWCGLYAVTWQGWSTSWEGFFWKLLSGRPVLHVEGIWREWWYEYLQPGR